jgi:hypothetical protein
LRAICWRLWRFMAGRIVAKRPADCALFSIHG